MNKKIHVAVVGTGFGSIVHMPGYSIHDKYKLVGIHGRSYEKAEMLAEKYNIKAYKSIDEIINDDEIDLVSITAIPLEHFDIAKKVMGSGKHVILEKPMTMNKQESAELLSIAEEKGSFNALVHEHRFDSSKAYAKHIIENKLFGSVRSIEIVKHMTYWNDTYKGRNYDWFSDRNLGGGMIGAHLSHQIDFLHFIDGIPLKWITGRAYVEVKKRYSKALEREEDHTSEDTVFVIAETHSGIPVSINISASKYRNLNYIKIFTSEGEIFITGQNDLQLYGKDGKLVSSTIPEEFLIKNYGEDFRLNTFVCFLEKFYDHYYRGIPQNITTFREGHEIQKVLDEIKRV